MSDTSTRPASILVVVDASAMAQWVIRLIEALRATAGRSVFLAVAEGVERDSALASLFRLEAIVLNHGRRTDMTGLDRAGVSGHLLAPDGFVPDLTIDLTQRGVAPVSVAPVLRPLYDGGPGETALASALLSRGTPHIEIARHLGGAEPTLAASGTASLEAASGTSGAMEAVYSRVAVLLEKALSGHDARQSRHLSNGRVPIVSLSRKDVGLRGVKIIARQAARAAYQLCCHPSHWRVGWRFAAQGQDVWSTRSLAGPRWAVLPDPVDHFYADPFPLHWRGRDYLFFEDLDYKTGKGIISVIAFDESGKPGPTMPVLEEPWHLSYPFLIEWDGDIWMIPESSGNRDIAAYRATNFPFGWERRAVLLSGLEAADATIARHGGLLWMLAVTRAGNGGYSDTLSIWSSTSLSGDWRPLANNPVLVDDRTARPAGNMVHRDGALYRPAQDCRGAYGAALNLMRVTRLDEGGFEQVPEQHVTADTHWPGRRIHTLNYNGRLEAVDGFVLRPKLKFLADRVDARFTPPV